MANTRKMSRRREAMGLLSCADALRLPYGSPLNLTATLRVIVD
jgi:hypothetical protein